MYWAPSLCETGKESEPGDLAEFQTSPLPKATFLQVLCKRVVGFNSATLPKTCRTESSHELLHCLGRSHGGNPGRACRWRRQRADWRKVWAFGIARSSRAKRAWAAGTLWQASSQRRRVSVSAFYPGTHLPGYRRMPLQHADMSVKPKAFVLHTGLSLTLAGCRVLSC